MAACAFSQRWQKEVSCDPESASVKKRVSQGWLCSPKVLVETLMHHFVQEYLWGLLGTRLGGDWEMDKSQQSLQADRITHREFLYDVTDGWIGCHG